MSIPFIKPKVNIVSCSFNEFRKFSSIPPQEGNYEIIQSLYNNENFPKRDNSLHPRLKGKIPKMLQYKRIDADYYIWMDSKFTIISNQFVNWMINNVVNSDMAVFNHYQRSSILDELNYMNSLMDGGSEYLLSRYSGEDMKSQVEEYLSDDTFKDDKLFACGMFIYKKSLIKNNPTFLTDWFFHNAYYSVQDQLSFPFLLHKHNVKYSIFSEHILHNNYIKYS